MAARLRIVCQHCQNEMVTERVWWNPGRVKVVCSGGSNDGCEAIIAVTLTSEMLAAAEFADSVVESALD